MRNGARLQTSLGYIKDRFGSKFRCQSSGARLQSQGMILWYIQKAAIKSQDRPKSGLVRKVESMEMDLKDTKKIVYRIEERMNKKNSKMLGEKNAGQIYPYSNNDK